MLAREIPRRELGERRERLRTTAAEEGLDGLVIWSRGGPAVDYYGDVLYLTNHFPPISSAEPDTELWSGRSYAALVLPVRGEPILIVDLPLWEPESVDVVDVRPAMHVAVGVAEALAETGLADGRVGLLGHHVFLASQERTIFETLGRRIDWIPADRLLVEMRMVKSEAEIAVMRKAGQIGVGWMASMMDAAVPGATEGQIAGAGLKFFAENGGIPADMDIASGPMAHELNSRAAIPTWDPGRVLEKGDLFHVDGWGSVGGYYTDTARTTIVAGAPDAAQSRIIEGTIALVDHLIEGFRPGVLCREINERGIAWLNENGFADAVSPPPDAGRDETLHFDKWPYFGHGIGLGIEPPWLTNENDTPLQTNMVLAVEVYLSTPGVGLAGFEQNVVVRDGEAENLTRGLKARWWE